MRSSWIDLGKEEHPRLIASSVSPAKKRWVRKFFWKRVQYQMAAYAPQLQVSPVGGSFTETFWRGGIHSKHVFKPPFGSCCVLVGGSAGETSAKGSLHEASGPFLTRVRELAYGFISPLFLSKKQGNVKRKQVRNRTSLKMDLAQQASATSLVQT